MDNELKDFFQRSKEEDLQQQIPGFNELYPTQKVRSLPKRIYLLGIAALILILLIPLYFIDEGSSTGSSQGDMSIIITLESPEETETAEDVSMFEWEPESTFLTEDF